MAGLLRIGAAVAVATALATSGAGPAVAAAPAHARGAALATGAASPAVCAQRRPFSRLLAGAAHAVPAAALAPVSRALGRNEPGYRVTRGTGGLAARDGAQRLTAWFGRAGVTVHSGPVAVGMRLAGYGYGTRLRAVQFAAPAAHANRVTYQGRGLAQWYANGPAGLEQGFTISAPPATPARHAPLTLALATSGGARATAAGGTVRFRQAGATLAYRNLAVTDARGKRLPAWLTLAPGRVLLHTSTAGARYPLTIDPVFQQLATFTTASGIGLGYSVALSGNTLAVGAPGTTVGDVSFAGAVYVFSKPTGGWADTTQATAELTADVPGASADLGFSVAMNDSTIVAGAPFGGGPPGAVYLFSKPGGGWASETQTAILTATASTEESLGISVGISGNTVVSGAPSLLDCEDLPGLAYVFTEPGGGWAPTETQTAILTSTDSTEDDGFGWSVAIEGATIVVGAPIINAEQGTVYLYTEPEGGWQTTAVQTSRLTAADGSAGDALGFSAALSGSTVVSGAVYATVSGHAREGAAYVFTEPIGGWAPDVTSAAKLTVSGGWAGESVGGSVATDGQEIVAGAYPPLRGGNAPGAAYVFTEPIGGWTSGQQSATLAAAGAGFGTGVALSGDLIAAGAPFARAGGNSEQGVAYLFGPGSAPPPPGFHLTGILSPRARAHLRAGSTITVTARVAYADGILIPSWLAGELGANCELTISTSGAQRTWDKCLRWDPKRQRFYFRWKTHAKPTGRVTVTIHLYYKTNSSRSEQLTLTPRRPRHR